MQTTQAKITAILPARILPMLIPRIPILRILILRTPVKMQTMRWRTATTKQCPEKNGNPKGFPFF